MMKVPMLNDSLSLLTSPPDATRPDPNQLATAPRAWGTAGKFRKFTAKLFDQQMWCWGADIRRPEGNLLMGYGFERHRAPDGRTSSAYIHDSLCGEQIVLWGFGAFFGVAQMGGLYIGRESFQPYMAAVSHLPTDRWSDRPARAENPTLGLTPLLVRFLGWVSRYERWVQHTLGSAYREATLQRWQGKMVICGAEMAATWAAVADEIRVSGSH